MEKRLRVGFIGAGGIAETHARYLAEDKRVDIVAAADISEKSRTKFQEKFKVKNVYPDYPAMLKQEALDAVSICTPNYLHAEPSILASQAGCHVLVEKPMAMTVAECKQMIEAAKTAQRQLVIGFQWRFSPNAQFMRKQVEDGVVGDVKFLRVQALRRRGIPSWGVFGRKDLQGGGPMIDIGVHIIEMAHHIIGKPQPVTASGSTYTYIGNEKPAVKTNWGAWDHQTYTVEDLAVGFVRFANGVTMAVEASFAAHIEKDVFNVQIMGSKAGLNFEPMQMYHDYHGYMLTATPSVTGKEDAFALKMKHFVNVACGEQPNVCPGEDGLMVQQILEGIYGSAEAGREVAIL